MILSEESINQKLIAACTAGNIDVAEECLKAGADPNTGKGSPLSKAINHNEELIKLLFRYDAKITPEIAIKAIKKKDLDLLDLFTVNGLDMNKELTIKTGSTYYGYSTDNYYPIECLFYFYKGINKFKLRTLKSLDLMIKYGAPTGANIIESCESSYVDYKYEVSDILRKKSGIPYSTSYIHRVIIANKEWDRLEEILKSKNIIFETSFEETVYNMFSISLNHFHEWKELKNFIDLFCRYIDLSKNYGGMNNIIRFLRTHEHDDPIMIINALKLLIKNGDHVEDKENPKNTLVNELIDRIFNHNLDSQGEDIAIVLKYLTSLGIKCSLGISPDPDDYRSADVFQKITFFLKRNAIELAYEDLNRHYIVGAFEIEPR